MVQGLLEYLTNPIYLPQFSWEVLGGDENAKGIGQMDKGEDRKAELLASGLVLSPQLEEKLSLIVGAVIVGLALIGAAWLWLRF